MNNACLILKKYRDVDGASLEKLSVICERLTEMNKVLNLTALKTDEDIALLHLYDSLTLLDTGLFDNKDVIDIGCGGGFPSLPLAACTNCRITSNDATLKKLKFVEDTARMAGIEGLSVLPGRAEELGRGEAREKYDICVSRGVARLNILVEWGMPFVKKGGYFIAMKGPGGYEEAEEAKKGISLLGGKTEKIIDCPIPQTDRVHTLVIIKKTENTPNEYPRANTKIMKKPL